MLIRIDDPRSTAAAAVLREHLAEVRTHSPPESTHALDIDRLGGADMTFWTAWENATILGCGALRELDAATGEIKSMRTVPQHRRKGVASAIVERIIETAARRGYEKLYLETGSQAAFAPARAFYARHGFRACGPFAEYNLDENSVFMVCCV